jgi:hypothetical protein
VDVVSGVVGVMGGALVMGRVVGVQVLSAVVVVIVVFVVVPFVVVPLVVELLFVIVVGWWKAVLQETVMTYLDL